MTLGQIAANVMLNKYVKFEDNSLNSIEVIGKIQFFPSL